MNTLEHQNMINDLHIENGSRSSPPEYPQYTEREEQAEFTRAEEWSAVKESGAPDTRRHAAAKTPSGKAVTMAQRLKQLMTFIALVAAAAIVVPDVIPALNLGSPELVFAEFYPGDEMISFSLDIETMSGDELTVTVQNDFIREGATLILGDFSYTTGRDENIEGEYFEEPQNFVEAGSEGAWFYMSETYFVSAGPDPTNHSISGDISGLQPYMTYRVTVICGGKTLFSDSVVTGSERSVGYHSSSKSSY